MMFRKNKSQKDSAKGNEKNTNTSGNRKLKIIAIVGMFLYAAFNLADYYGVTDLLNSSTDSESTSSFTLAEMAGTQESKSPQVMSQTITDSDTNSTGAIKPVKLVNAQAFDDLTGLYFLASRVRESDKDAATVFGLTRISIHAKRNQLIESQLKADNSKYELTFETNSKQIRDIKDGVEIPANKSTDPIMVADGSSMPNFPSYEEGFGVKEPASKSESLQEDSNELKSHIYKPRDFVLNAIVNGKASLKIKGEDFNEVLKGQMLLSRFEVQNFDYNLYCVTIFDHDEERNFVTCING